MILLAFASEARADQFMPYMPDYASDSLRAQWALRFERAPHIQVRHTESRLRPASFRTAIPCDVPFPLLHAADRIERDTMLVRFLAAAIRGATPTPGLRNTCTDSLGRDEITLAPEDDGKTLEVNFTPGKGILTITDAKGLTATDRLGPRSAELLAILTRVLPDDLRLESIEPCAAAIGSTEAVVETLPAATKKVPPDYADEARANGIEGVVIVLALVDVNGRVARTVLYHSTPPLDAGAVQAVEQWRFKPAMSNGQPVPVWIAVPVKFMLH